jgi:hypothetical protein
MTTIASPEAMITEATCVIVLATACMGTSSMARTANTLATQLAKSSAIHADRERTIVPITCAAKKSTAAAPATIPTADRVLGTHDFMWAPIPATRAGAPMIRKETPIRTAEAASLPNQIDREETGRAK